jgi:hypothetical protein
MAIGLVAQTNLVRLLLAVFDLLSGECNLWSQLPAFVPVPL